MTRQIITLLLRSFFFTKASNEIHCVHTQVKPVTEEAAMMLSVESRMKRYNLF